MTFAEIEALPSAAERAAAYQAYVEQFPQHPLAWFNLAVESEAMRAYDQARSAGETLRRLDADVFAMLPERLRALLGVAPAAAHSERQVDGYRITGVAAASESQILYDAVRVADESPHTLLRVLDLGHAGARAFFQSALEAPRVEGLARPFEIVSDPVHGPLLVLEPVRGLPLRGEARARLDAEVALRLVRSVAVVARALQAGGALHGDLRPDSVLRTRSHERDVVVIGGQRAVAPVAVTRRGRLPWISPEEAAGEPVTSATDVYGIGLLLHHLLTGSEPGPLEERSPLRVGSDWPELDELIAQATAREPAARPSIDEFIERIEQMLALRDVPRVIGRWRLGRLIGEGGFGRVFAAENVDIPELRAAIKVLNPLLARDRDIRRRFLNEASAASRIDHPGVVRVLDGGVEPSGVCYVAMELLQGEDLATRLAKGPLAIEVAIELGLEAASALAAAHARAIVHRDIKPSNLFVEHRADGEHLKVLDFGTALLRGDPTREGVPYTTTGHLWGTPEYMAPEQWRMARDLDARVDIYSLGLVLWECLAGRRPYSAATVFDWQQAHLVEPVPSLRAARPQVPLELAAVVEHMLEKDRDRRTATMLGVVSELERAAELVRGSSARTLRLDPGIPVLVPQARRSRWPYWVAGTVGAGVLAFLVYEAFVPEPPSVPDCTQRVFLEWGPLKCPSPRALVWSYDPQASRCVAPLFSRSELRDELEALRRAGAAGFRELPAGFELVLYDGGTGVKTCDAQGATIPRANLFVSYQLRSDVRVGGVRIYDKPPVFLSRDGYWCDESGRVVVRSVHAH